MYLVPSCVPNWAPVYLDGYLRPWGLCSRGVFVSLVASIGYMFVFVQKVQYVFFLYTTCSVNHNINIFFNFNIIALKIILFPLKC